VAAGSREGGAALMQKGWRSPRTERWEDSGIVDCRTRTRARGPHTSDVPRNRAGPPRAAAGTVRGVEQPVGTVNCVSVNQVIV
jgi:hypothetical protein